jgi:hypothetical protein
LPHAELIENLTLGWEPWISDGIDARRGSPQAQKIMIGRSPIFNKGTGGEGTAGIKKN